jgi:hypothetical protein
MANYTKTTDFAAKDTLPGGDTNKVVRGAEFETEFDAISTAIATKSDTASPTFTGTVTIPTVDINAGAIDGTVIGANSAAAGTFSDLTATTADINAGTIDNAVIGGSTAAAGTFTNLTASGTVNFSGATISNLGTITTANLDGGTVDNAVIGGASPAAGTFTDLTANSSFTSGNVDINGGAIDGTVIGASSAAAGTFAAVAGTTGTFSGAVTGSNLNVSNWDTAFGWGDHSTQGYLTSVAFTDIAAGAVTLSSETFSDVDNQIPTNAAVIDYVAATIPLISEVNDLSAAVTWANVPDANITESSVTQHQAALAITQSQITGGVSPTFTATASGTLANGDTVIVNSNGTVSAVAETVSSTPEAQSSVKFTTGSAQYVAATFDSSNNKVVICYKNLSNSNYLEAIVGTISGKTISFGTAVVIESSEVRHVAAAFDSTNNKVVVAYADFPTNDYGRARVLTVSGTSISSGSEATFAGSSQAFETSMAFDSNAGKVVIAYKGASDQGKAIVGTVSGTSITFGSEATFNAATTNDTSICFDPDNNKVVIAYQDVGNSSHGTAIVGTISGTSISFGSEVVFEAADTRVPSIVYDTSNDKVVISYIDAGNSNQGTSIVGTVSGTSVSFGTAVVFDASALNNETLSSTFDSSANKVIIAFEDQDNSNYGTAVVGTVSGTSISFTTPLVYFQENISFVSVTFDSNVNESVICNRGTDGSGNAIVFSSSSLTTNLTAENYIGISNAAYSDGATATIQVVGSVDDAQSSLTPGQSYFVQNNGSLGLTAGDPSVFAGTAVSATEIIVKG